MALFRVTFSPQLSIKNMRNLVADLRFALRTLAKSPIFTGVAVLSLALGIGANTAIFSLLDQILLRLLPVKRPAELVLLTMRGSHYGSNWGGNAISYPMYRDFKDHNEVFSGMFCRFPLDTSLTFENQTERVDIAAHRHLPAPLLRRHVRGRAGDQRPARHVGRQCGETEVADARMTAAIDHDVGGLEIAVDDFAIVRRR